MGVLIDSSLLIALAVDDDRAASVAPVLNRWIAEDQPLFLFQYEVANGLTRLVVAGLLPAERVATAWSRASEISIEFRPITDGASVIAVARQLRRSSAYDATYIALAQELAAEDCTLKGSISREALGGRFPVRPIETLPREFTCQTRMTPLASSLLSLPTHYRWLWAMTASESTSYHTRQPQSSRVSRHR